jgi:S1-C subfamily serine protease
MLQEVSINPKVKAHYNLANQKGLFVTRIEENSPAALSQLAEGDIIISFHNRTVNTSHELFRELSRKDILDVVDITVIRHSQLLNFTVTPAAAKH